MYDTYILYIESVSDVITQTLLLIALAVML